MTLPTKLNVDVDVAGAKIVTKWDTNSGFWQRKSSSKLKLLTTFITPCGQYCY